MAAALAVLAVIAGDYARTRLYADPVPPPLDPATLKAGMGPVNYTVALRLANSAVESARYRVERIDDNWVAREMLAEALLARARLSGSAADAHEANAVLDKAMAMAPWPGGPVLVKAQAALYVHDLAGAEKALARFAAWKSPPTADEGELTRSIRCEIAFQRGQLADARELCGGGMAGNLRRANLLLKQGKFDEAAQGIEAVLRRPNLPPHALAVISLQRASVALAQGDWATSARWIATAEKALPGFWLTEAWAAQQAALEGRADEAYSRYEALAGWAESPEVFDALARLADARGQREQALAWAAKAEAIWGERQRLLPGTYASHYADHLLQWGDARAALVLDESEFAARPHAHVIAHLCFALLRNGQADRALEVSRDALDKGWLTAELKLAEAQALGALGRADEAGKAIAAAREINPKIADLRQPFLAFSGD